MNDKNQASTTRGVTGTLLTSADVGDNFVSAPFAQALVDIGRIDSRIVALTADLGKYTDVDGFAQCFPERFFQVGMAEQNMMGIAAGLARTGCIPFATTYCVFATRRAYDFIAMGAALGKANVKVIAGLPGLTTGYGGTHQGIEDIALMRSVPNLVVIDPCDATELTQAVAAIASYQGPVYMRLLRGKVSIVLDPNKYRFELGRAKLLQDGDDVLLISTGLMTGRALDAAKQLGVAGISAAVLHIGTIKPLDRDSLLSVIRRHQRVVVAENHFVSGGLASAIADILIDAGISVRLRRIGIPDVFCESGSIPYLNKRYRMNAEDIVSTVHAMFGK